MTVKELQRKLAQRDPDATVLIDDTSGVYEIDGLEDDQIDGEPVLFILTGKESL